MKHTFEPDRAWKERFWARVDKSVREKGCWLWTGYVLTGGYGQVTAPGRRGSLRAHVASFLLDGGVLTEERPLVLHTCHNRVCVFPGHLYAGTHQENMEDMRSAGRAATGGRHGSRTRPDKVLRGEHHGKSKLTEAQVLSIRKIHEETRPRQIDLAALFGVSRTAIGKVLRRKVWGWLTE